MRPLKVIPWSPFKGLRPGKKLFGREPDLKTQGRRRFYMITTPLIISTISQIGLGTPRDRQPVLKRNFPDSLPVVTQGESEGLYGR